MNYGSHCGNLISLGSLCLIYYLLCTYGNSRLICYDRYAELYEIELVLER